MSVTGPSSPISPTSPVFPPFHSPSNTIQHRYTRCPSSSSSLSPPTATATATNPHAYRPPNGASRSPCPCLNALANHSYLPHSGRNITFSDIISSLQNGMGLSHGFAIFMAIGTFTLLRRPTLAPFDLYGTARHNFIEHNASLVHDDAAPGEKYASIDVDLTLLDEFLSMAHRTKSSGEEEVITGHDIAESRIRREAESGPVDALHAELGRAELAMVMEIFGQGKDKELVKRDVDIFFREERFPDGWTPTHVFHLWEAAARSQSIRRAMNKIKEEGTSSSSNAGVWAWLQDTVHRLVARATESL